MLILVSVGEVFAATWGTKGVSEFLSAALGGAMTIVAQSLALRHDRKKGEALRRDGQKGVAWAIFFKINRAYDQFAWVSRDLKEARENANGNQRELWQVFQVPPHDLEGLSWETSELVFLVDHKQFDLMMRYQMATIWMANLAQSIRLYRDMRIEFLLRVPSQMKGDMGSIEVNDTNASNLMPTIAHLRSLSDSLEDVVSSQYPDLRQLLIDYGAAMKAMIGKAPKLEFPEPKEAGAE